MKISFTFLVAVVVVLAGTIAHAIPVSTSGLSSELTELGEHVSSPLTISDVSPLQNLRFPRPAESTASNAPSSSFSEFSEGSGSFPGKQKSRKKPRRRPPVMPQIPRPLTREDGPMAPGGDFYLTVQKKYLHLPGTTFAEKQQEHHLVNGRWNERYGPGAAYRSIHKRPRITEMIPGEPFHGRQFLHDPELYQRRAREWFEINNMYDDHYRPKPPALEASDDTATTSHKRPKFDLNLSPSDDES